MLLTALALTGEHSCSQDTSSRGSGNHSGQASQRILHHSNWGSGRGVEQRRIWDQAAKLQPGQGVTASDRWGSRGVFQDFITLGAVTGDRPQIDLCRRKLWRNDLLSGAGSSITLKHCLPSWLVHSTTTHLGPAQPHRLEKWTACREHWTLGETVNKSNQIYNLRQYTRIDPKQR